MSENISVEVIKDSVLSIFKGCNLKGKVSYHYDEAINSVQKTIGSVHDNADPVELADKLISDLVAIESIITVEGGRKVVGGQVFLPRPEPRYFKHNKLNELGDLINMLACAIKVAES